MDVKKTHLYKTLAPCIRKQDRAMFARELQRVADNHTVGPICLNQDRLVSAFAWAESPQWWTFWHELDDRLRAAGHYAAIAKATKE